MVHSWSSNITNIPQESKGIEIIRSIFHSINVNQHKLPDISTYSELKPRNFNKVVNSVSNQLKFNPKAKSKLFHKNNSGKKCIQLSNNSTPVFQQTSYRSSDPVPEGESNSDKSTDPNISLDKVNLLWMSNPKKYKSSNEKINSYINKNPMQTSVPFNQRRLEEIRQCVEHILIQEDDKSLNNSSVRIHTSKDKFSLNINKNKYDKSEKYHHINLSIKNYYQSSDSLKKFENSHEKILHQDSLNTVKLNRQKTLSCKKEIETNYSYESKSSGKSKNASNMISNLNSTTYRESIKCNQFNTADDSVDKKINLKSNSATSKLSAVLTGQFKTAAKPSKMLIPQNFRGRALFQSFMHMNDLPEENEVKRSNKNNYRLKSSSENLKSFKIKNRKGNSPVNLTRKSCDSQKLKSQNNIITEEEDKPETRLLRSKTFITEKKSDFSIDKNVNNKIEINDEQINVVDIKNLKHSLKLDEISSEKEFFCELIEVNKIIKKNSTNKLNNLTIKNLKPINLLNDNKNKEINSNNNLNEVNKTVSLKNNKLDQVDIFTETECLSQLSKVDTFTETDFSMNQLNLIDTCTETDLIDCEQYKNTPVNLKNSCENLMSFMSTNKISSPVFLDASVFCNIPLINTIKEESFEDLFDHKSYCATVTQTSETLLMKYFSKEKKDASMETKKSNCQYKDTNTEPVVLIDTATGRDRFDTQNFNCDTQSINTDNNVYGMSSENFKITCHDVECQIGKLNRLVSIDFDKISTTGSAMSFEQVVSNLSSELISSQKSLLECTSKLSDYDIVSHGSLNNIPTEVIRAFKIATERAQNLFQAYKIYQEYEKNKQKSYDYLVENNQEKISPNVTMCGKKNPSHLIRRKISDFGLQEIKFTVQNILNRVEEKMISIKEEDKLQNYKDEKFTNNSSELLLPPLSSSSSSLSSFNENVNSLLQPTISRKTILPIIYGTLCSFIFWSLQFSASYEIN